MKRKTVWTRLRNAPGQIRWLVVRAARSAVGLDTSLRTEDRRVLEETILPWFAKREDARRVLFVGCDWYTRQYQRLFADREYWTLEMDPRRRRYGARRHVTASIVELGRYFEPGSLDVIIMNGVLGWGLNDAVQAEAAIAACGLALRREGSLVVGWNDIPEKKVLDLETSAGIASFDAWTFPALGTARYLTPGRARHTYDFFRRR